MSKPRGVIRYYMGRFRVPRWFFEASPGWLHAFADRLGGVE